MSGLIQEGVRIFLEHQKLLDFVLDFVIAILTLGGFVFTQSKKRFGLKPALVLACLAIIAGLLTWNSIYASLNGQAVAPENEVLNKEITELRDQIKNLTQAPSPSQSMIDKLNSRLNELEKRSPANRLPASNHTEAARHSAPLLPAPAAHPAATVPPPPANLEARTAPPVSSPLPGRIVTCLVPRSQPYPPIKMGFSTAAECYANAGIPDD